MNQVLDFASPDPAQYFRNLAIVIRYSKIYLYYAQSIQSRKGTTGTIVSLDDALQRSQLAQCNEVQSRFLGIWSSYTHNLSPAR
jgi:hypothetical protein